MGLHPDMKRAVGRSDVNIVHVVPTLVHQQLVMAVYSVPTSTELNP